jgi:hypothetical protein
MTPAELHARNEMDQEILYYVREMQARAPVTAESITGFLTVARRRKVTAREVQDRIDYLVSAKYLDPIKEWQGGEFVHYRITADGVDVLDGAVPPRGWKP